MHYAQTVNCIQHDRSVCAVRLCGLNSTLDGRNPEFSSCVVVVQSAFSKTLWSLILQPQPPSTSFNLCAFFRCILIERTVLIGHFQLFTPVPRRKWLNYTVYTHCSWDTTEHYCSIATFDHKHDQRSIAPKILSFAHYHAFLESIHIRNSNHQFQPLCILLVHSYWKNCLDRSFSVIHSTDSLLFTRKWIINAILVYLKIHQTKNWWEFYTVVSKQQWVTRWHVKN